MSSNAQIKANQQNAQLSTGPTTEAGKQISSQNAAKHGFTGLSLIVTPAEKEAYDAHVQAYMDHYQPVDHMHRQVVQQYADLHWSLHQIFVQQSNTMSLMNAVAIQLNAAGDPIATAAAIAPIAKTLNTLNLYETRRRRALKTVQEELDLLTQSAAEAQAKLRAEIPAPLKEAPPQIGSVHSAPRKFMNDAELEVAMEHMREQIRLLEDQEAPEIASRLNKLTALD